MTECNGCGACCDPVVLPVSPGQLAAMGNRLADGVWLREHLHPMGRPEGRARQPWAKGKGWSERIDDEGNPIIEAVFYYQCDRYDPVAKQCTDYDGRPGMCRSYPWADGIANPGADLPPTCSYRADIGLAVESNEVAVAAPARRGDLPEGEAARRKTKDLRRPNRRTTPPRKRPNFPGKSTF